MVIQTTFRRYEQAGWPGHLAYPRAPYSFDSGQIRVPTGGVDPMPGYAVYWDETNDRFALPTTDAQQQLVCGILSYDSGTVGTTVTATENSTLAVQYENDDVVKVGVLGTFWGIAAETMKYGDPVEWEWRTTSPTVTDGEQKWKKRTAARIGITPIVVPATGTTNGFPTAWDGDEAKAAVDTVLATLQSTFFRLPIAVANTEPVAANELVLLRVGYQFR